MASPDTFFTFLTVTGGGPVNPPLLDTSKSRTPDRRNVSLRHRSALDLAMTLTFDLLP